MITKEDAVKIAIDYLKLRNRNYNSICAAEKVSYWENDEVIHGKHEGKIMNTYTVSYGVIWGNEERRAFVMISSETGEVLYSMNSHGWIEELEDE
jgi:hypothetical protein